MESEAKMTAQCDNCKSTIDLKKPKATVKGKPPEPVETLQAKLSSGPNGDVKDFHFCDEECLRQFLNKRNQRAKASSDEPSASGLLSLEEGAARYISTKKRDEMKDSDFVDPERRSFPIKNCTDVHAAIHAWGRYKGSMSFEAFKTKITHKAHELGCTLPSTWTEKK